MLFYYIAFFHFHFHNVDIKGKVFMASFKTLPRITEMLWWWSNQEEQQMVQVQELCLPQFNEYPCQVHFLQNHICYLLKNSKQIYTYLNFHEFDIIINRTRITRRRASLRKCKTISQNSQTAPSSRKTRSRG